MARAAADEESAERQGVREGVNDGVGGEGGAVRAGERAPRRQEAACEPDRDPAGEPEAGTKPDDPAVDTDGARAVGRASSAGGGSERGPDRIAAEGREPEATGRRAGPARVERI